MRSAVLAACVLSLPVPVAAQEGCFGAGTPLFHCTAGAKALDLCLQGEVMVYRFGPRNGPAELLLARRVEGVGLVPWNGVGRYIWEELSVFNQTYAYVVTYSVDRQPSGEPKATGGVSVIDGGKTLAEVSCDAGSVAVADFYPVFEAKEAAGQCWSTSDFQWEPC